MNPFWALMVSYDTHREVFPTGQKEVTGHLAHIWTFYEHSGEAKFKRMKVFECLNPSVKLFFRKNDTSTQIPWQRKG